MQLMSNADAKLSDNFGIDASTALKAQNHGQPVRRTVDLADQTR